MTTKPKNITLTMDRTYRAPPERVYRAWTREDEIVQWVAPDPNMDTTAELDVREGGEYVIHMGPYTVRGTYEEIVPDEKLVFTWRWNDAEAPGHMLVTVTLEEAPGGGTNMRLFHENLPSDESREQHTQGWTGSFARLEAVLADAS